ncbi:MAG: porin family protein, partial [Rhizobiales bacterium]|nr:porin family protein [Hyphomicrobiales bacterium]
GDLIEQQGGKKPRKLHRFAVTRRADCCRAATAVTFKAGCCNLILPLAGIGVILWVFQPWLQTQKNGDWAMKLSKTLTALGVLAIGLGVGAAQAADLPVREPVYKGAPFVQAQTWTGAYVGLHAGYAWGSGAASVGPFTSDNGDIEGGFGGGQIGYNWQAPGANWVLGVEADVSGGDIGNDVTVPGVGSASTSINVMGTVRGRVGFLFTPQTLVYTTAGFAWARNKVDINVPGLLVASSSATHTGWAAGAGIEHAFAPNWTARLEYLHTDYGTETYFNSPVGLSADTDQVRVGINYLFR